MLSPGKSRFLRILVLAAHFCSFPAVAAEESPEQRIAKLLQAGLAGFSSGDYAEADSSLSEAVKIASAEGVELTRLDRIKFLIASSRYQLGKHREAAKDFAQHLADYPDSPDRVQASCLHGMSLFHAKDYAEAFKALDDFTQKHPAHPQFQNCTMMAAMSLANQGDDAQLVAYLQPKLGTLRPDLAGYGQLLVLESLSRTDRDAALAFASEIDMHSPSAVRLGALQIQLIKLAEQFAEEEKHRHALAALHLTWSRDNVIKSQRARLKELRDRVEAGGAEAKTGDPLAAKLVSTIEQELKQLEQLRDFDEIRLGRSVEIYLGLGRYREAHLLIARMLDSLPDSKILAALNFQLINCHARMGNWPEAIREAQQFAERFPESEDLADAIYLQAEAEMRLGLFEEASTSFLLLFEKFPESRHGPRAHFLAGYALLNAEENARAITLFDDHARRFAKDEFAQDAAYWRAMAMLYDAEWESARKAHEAYLTKFPEGAYATDSRFRIAYTLFREKQYGKAIEHLVSFLEDHPDDALHNEANNLLGDCHFAEGRVTEGLEVFGRSKFSGQDDSATYDYAVFRTAAGLRGLEEKEKLRAHLSGFLEQRKDSPRVPEAIGLLGSLHRSEGDMDQAREIYWQAVETYGNDPEAEAVEGILLSLAKLYRGSEDAGDFDGILREKSGEAAKAGKATLAARLKWIRTANANEKEKPELLRQIGGSTPLRELPATILAELGEHYASAGKEQEARECYRTILSWWPRSRARDLAWAGLGLLAAGQSKHDEALEWFDRYEDQAGDMRLLPGVVLARAGIYEEQGRVKDATAEYNRVLGMRAARGLPVVTALTRLGELYEKQGEWQLAIPYYQRVYVLYGHFAAQSARAYLRSAEAFERLDRQQEAANTIDEMLSMENLKETPEYAEAAKKAKSLPAPNRATEEETPEA